jgi:hypothetical protein
LRFRRCDHCDTIAVLQRTAPDSIEYACRDHDEGEGWTFICSLEGCDRPPIFKVDYRMGGKHAHLTVCPEHFQILPDERFDVFRMD